MEIENEELRAGDMVKLWCGVGRVMSVKPYTGPLTEIIFAIAECEPSKMSFSLERGGYTTIVPRDPV